MGQIEPIGNCTGYEPPAKKVVRLFGERELMRLTGLSSDGLKKWRRSKTTGGGGGLVPAYYQQRLLSAAEALGLDLRAADFIAEPY